MAKSYNHHEIEAKWNKIWAETNQFVVDPKTANEKFYCLDMFPYPSGDGLHVGHWRGYVMSDFYARYMRLQGKTVLHPMGFDAFGLPAENAAIKNNSHPKKFTDSAIETFSKQLKQIGAAYDWTKTLNTSSPEYYHWTQWLFLQLFKKGFAEKRKSLVNWCPKDQTVLANEQVVNGCCERCGSKVTKKELEQWYFLTTKLAEELLDGLDTVDWPEHVKTLQRNWIGKSTGATVTFAIDGAKETVDVFTTRPDTIFGVNAVVLAPEHPLAKDICNKNGKEPEFSAYYETVAAKTNVDRAQSKETAKTAIFTGAYAVHSLTQEKLPIWIADYVLMEYGTGAVMSVPAHDERDFQFAKAHDLPIKQVVSEQLTQSFEPGMYRPEMPTVTADGVIVFVKHWKEEKYIGLRWKKVDWGTLLTGNIDEGSTPEETALNEIHEETGYMNAKIVEKLGIVDGLFYHVPKEVNKLVHGHVFIAKLDNDEKTKVSDEENEKHHINWLTTEELAGFLTADTHKYALKWLKNGYTPATGPGSLINSGTYSGQSSEEAADRIVADLETAGVGKFTTTYRLRDWLVSRQRYWGAPIPIVYDPEGKPHPVEDEHLPVQLPEDVDFAAISKKSEPQSGDDLLPGSESPLARSTDYQKLAEKLYEKGWHFDTDTLDTFVDSSWYFLRYLTPNNDKVAFDKDLVEKWLPVDLYIGGIEHATLHLLYARFMYRFLAENGYINASDAEPFKKLFNIGMINMHGAKMSKSKGNVVSPDPLIQHYGTDALRGYELFISPLDIEAEWSPNGINGVHRFLIKASQLSDKVTSETTPEMKAAFEQYLGQINDMIANFRLNTVISEYMKLANTFEKIGISQEIFEKFVVTLSPIFPYLAEELYHNLGHDQSVFLASWPVSSGQTVKKQIPVLLNQRFVVNIDDPGSQEAAELILAKNNAIQNKVAGKKIRVVYKNKTVINILVS